jgi:hypothetical protein
MDSQAADYRWRPLRSKDYSEDALDNKVLLAGGGWGPGFSPNDAR